jgi:hypothetical protein
MKRFLRSVGAALPLAGVTAVILAQTVPALDVKFGLWEMAMTVDIGGTPPQMDTSKMTPAQKAQMEAAMKEMMGQHTSTKRQCVTKADLAKSMGETSPGQTCKDTVTTNTGTVYDVTRACTGERTEKAQIHMEAVGREAMKGMVKSSTTEDGRTQTANISFTGKWVAADCGKEK